MEMIKYEVIELSFEEANDIEGGFIPMVVAAIAICGAYYGAGYAIGQALHHAIN